MTELEQAWASYQDTRKDGKRVRVLGRNILVKTLPVEQKSQNGLIWLAPGSTNFLSGPMHLRKMKGIVMTRGPNATRVKEGDVIMFVRQHFAKWVDLRNGTYIGHIDEAQVLGFPNPPDVYLD